MTRHSNRRPTTTGPLGLTLLAWTPRRSLAVDLFLSLNDRIAEMRGAKSIALAFVRTPPSSDRLHQTQALQK